MKKRQLPILLVLVFCKAMCFAQTTSPKPELLFQSGFEGNSRVVSEAGSNDYGARMEHIEGMDTTYTKKNDWRKDIQGFVGSGQMRVQYTGGDSTKRFARIVPEPDNPSNHVLKFWLNDSWVADMNLYKARVQTNLYGIRPLGGTIGFRELYQSVRVFLTDDFNALKTYPRRISWCTISEFWNNEWWVKTEPYGFRITLGIGKPTADVGDLRFILNAENPGQKEVWRANAEQSNVAVPIGRWFTLDYYFREGNGQTGRFYVAITPDGQPKQVVYDITNFTHNTTDPAPNGLTGYNPMKLYTSRELINHVKAQGKTLQIYWDDFALWKDKRPQ